MYMNERIETNPNIMLGKPVVKGTRITVELILRQLAQGLEPKAILENYPNLRTEDIKAAIEYAATLVEEELVYSLKTSYHGKVAAFA